MEIKVRFEPLVNNYLRSKYPDGIRYDLSDNLTIYMFSLLMVPKMGEITKDETDGVSILLTQQFYECGRVFIPEKVKPAASRFVVNQIYNELFQEISFVLQNNRLKRYKGLNDFIHKFMVRYNLDHPSDFERFKKAFYRFKKKQEKNFVDFVPKVSPRSIYG